MIMVLNDAIMFLASASGERKKQASKKSRLRGCEWGCFALLKRRDAQFTVHDYFYKLSCSSLLCCVVM